MTDSEIENIQQMQQEIERLRNENDHLRRELYPPESPKEEFKYWIVTWLYKDAQGDTRPDAVVAASWVYASDLQAGLKTTGRTHIQILEQRVLL